MGTKKGVDLEDPTVIVLDKPRRLVLDMNAIKDFESATNKNFWQLKGVLSGTDNLALLWACLRQEDELLTQHAVGKLIPITRMIEVDQKLGQLMMAVLPEPERQKVLKALEDAERKDEASPLAVEE